jgi:hypothetical protein
VPVFFVKPSWSSSFAGASLGANNLLLRQEVDLGGHANAGLMGATTWRNVELELDNENIAAIALEEPVSEYMGEPRLAFQIAGKAQGETDLTAFVDNVARATMKVVVTGNQATDAIYVDRFIGAYYDVDYKHQGGNYSKILVLRYVDDVVVDLNLDRILDAPMDPEQSAQLIATSAIGDGGKKFPQQLNRGTTPRLVAAKRSALESMNATFLEFLVVAERVVEFVLAAAQVMQLSGQLMAIRTPRTRVGLPPPVKRVIGPKPPRVTPQEVQEALDAARREHSTTTPYHGGQRDIPAGRPFSTTDSLEHARIYAQRNNGQIYRYEVPKQRLRELEQLQNTGQPGVRRMVDSLQGTTTNATEYRFTSEFLARGGLQELSIYRHPLPIP